MKFIERVYAIPHVNAYIEYLYIVIGTINFT